MTVPLTPAEPKPTHWAVREIEDGSEIPAADPIEAARSYLKEYVDTERQELDEGFGSIKVQGYIEGGGPLVDDDDMGEDRDSDHDGEPGTIYFIPVGDPVTVIVERTMRIEEAK